MARLFFGGKMASVTIYNEANGDVLRYLKSAHTPDYSSRTDVVINQRPPRAPIEYWKVDAGTLREMTAAEKTDKDARLKGDRDGRRRTDIDNLDVEAKTLLRSLRRLGALTGDPTDEEISTDIKNDEGL